MSEVGFPHEILNLPVRQRVDYFVNYVMSHPILLQVFEDLMIMLYQAGGPSLIFLLGPTGAGKTTLLKRLVEKVDEKALEQMQIDKGYIPIAGFSCASPEFSQFDWHDFYIRGLKALDDPFIGNDEKRRPTKRLLRSTFEDALKNRHPDAFYLDEAHNLCKVPTGKKLVDQTDCLKSISNNAGVRMLLTSTYQADILLDLSDQLCRRSTVLHFPRYRIETSAQKKVFKSLIKNVSLQLPLVETPDFTQHWDFIYERCCGCFGTLKDWFSRTLGAVLEKDANAKTLLITDLEKYALSAKKCLVIMKAILAGEKKMEENEESLKALRRGLGLPEKSDGSDFKSNEKQNKSTAAKRKDVGKPTPQSYPVGERQNENGEPPLDKTA
jgi:hypothetical protein